MKIEHIPGPTVQSFIRNVFIVCLSRELLKHIDHVLSSHIKLFQKTRSSLKLPASVYKWLLKKSISQAIFYWLTKFHRLIAFSSWDVGDMGIVVVCFPSCGLINVKIDLNFLIKSFSHMTKKLRTKT